MFSSVWTVGLSIVFAAGPVEFGSPGGYAYPGGMIYSAGPPAAAFDNGTYFGPSLPAEYPYVGPGASAEQLYPYDAQEPWRHGHFQEIPAYGGFHAFRPYNYKHVFAQAQAAGGWGMSSTMPYSQQFWHRYQRKAALQEQLSQAGLPEHPADLPRGISRWNSGTSRDVASKPSWQTTPIANVPTPASAHIPGRQETVAPAALHWNSNPAEPVDRLKRRSDRWPQLGRGAWGSRTGRRR